MSYFQVILANFVIFRDHYAMTISQQTLRKERSFSVFFITYFVVISTKTNTSLVSTYLYPRMIKLRRKSYNLSQKSLFGRQNNLSPYVPLQRVTMFSPLRTQNSLRKSKYPIPGNSLIVYVMALRAGRTVAYFEHLTVAFYEHSTVAFYEHSTVAFYEQLTVAF